MKTYNIDKIRNVALIGHASCGKTTLTESLLFATKVTNRMGKIEDGKFIDSISEYDVVENYDMLFANLEAGKELAVMINEAEDVKVKRFKNPFIK